ncbi:MAG: flap endonuclease-1 [Candidatus Aenigmarchaeota archaeon]
MGINISEIVKFQELEMTALMGRTIVIDAYNWTYQFLSTIRDRFTGEPLRDSKGNTTSHLSGLFYRTAKILEAGITPVYVWDGKPPDFKLAEIERRQAGRAAAKELWKEAVKKGDVEKIKLYAQQAVRLTKDMVEEAKKLLTYMGISWIQAPSEGEAQCSHMCRKGQAWATASQDFDSLAFGSPRLIRNLSITGKRKLPRKEQYINVKPEMLVLEDALKELGINQDQLILLGILVGTDYNTGGIKGIGPKKALDLVKKEKTFENVMKAVEARWEHESDPMKIFEFFKNPPAEDVEIKKEKLQPDKLIELMVEEHEFGQERMQKVIDRLSGAAESQKQTGLAKFLG